MSDDDDGRLPLLEYWPDYGAGPLWQKDGVVADLDALSLPGDLAERLHAFNTAYEEDRLPIDGDGDMTYLADGTRLLAEVRAALTGRFRVVVTEPWWGEPPSDYER
jgi:hypothetical protein